MIYNFDYECRKRFTAFATKYFYFAPEAWDKKGALKPKVIRRCIRELVGNDILTVEEIRAAVKLPEEYYKI